MKRMPNGIQTRVFTKAYFTMGYRGKVGVSLKSQYQIYIADKIKI